MKSNIAKKFVNFLNKNRWHFAGVLIYGLVLFLAFCGVYKFLQGIERNKISNGVYSLLSQNIENDLVTYTNLTDITQGQYSGFHRILIFIDTDYDHHNDNYFVLATNNYKQFLLDKESNTTSINSDIFKKEKIFGVADLRYDFPKTTIDIGNFQLLGGDIYRLEDINSYSKDLGSNLSSKINGFAVYESIHYGSDVYLKSENGLYFLYHLGFKNSSHESDKVSDNKYHLYSKDIESSNKIFTEYGPGVCGSSANKVRTDISDVDLVKIGQTKTGINIYIPKNKTDPAYKVSYDLKLSHYLSDKNHEGVYGLSPLPQTYEEYISNNPIIFIKDPWSRWIELKESFYNSSDGC